MTDFVHALGVVSRGIDWLELTGLVSGFVCVVLLIRQNVWTFPVGLVYAFVSVAVFAEQRLYADVLLSGYYVLMNGYGWYYWLYGGRRSSADDLPVTHLPRSHALNLGGVVAVGIAGMGWFFETRTDAALPYWDSATTVSSFAAMWLTARKYIENWIVWWIVDIIAVAIYVTKGIELYATLYAMYLAMAVMGWRAWQHSMTPTAPSV